MYLMFKNVLGKAEPVVRRCSVRKVFLEISRNSQEKTFARVSFLIKLQEKAGFSEKAGFLFCLHHLIAKKGHLINF